ncbi:hypothetical protein [Phenylobacterium sp.]|uniref:hypothetical protein n=1 Tax=Phenylobacterium sp. TaxID=1871053 RepID=UPI002DF72EB2|nr:hypothetical protein [Phenylobacterium sp.]
MRQGALALALAALALFGCRQAAGVQAPPARYDTGPLPADLTYDEVDAAEVGAVCRSFGDTSPEDQVLACYVFAKHVIVLPTRASDPVIYPALKRHEEGHARGWPANHPS